MYADALRAAIKAETSLVLAGREMYAGICPPALTRQTAEQTNAKEEKALWTTLLPA